MISSLIGNKPHKWNKNLIYTFANHSFIHWLISQMFTENILYCVTLYRYNWNKEYNKGLFSYSENSMGADKQAKSCTKD